MRNKQEYKRLPEMGGKRIYYFLVYRSEPMNGLPFNRKEWIHGWGILASGMHSWHAVGL
jgi:hypothetical protein